MSITEGQVVAGKYRIEKLLGEGGMGSVFVATNTVLQRKVALKVMGERFASVPSAVERFLREAVAASRVSHPSIVQVFDAGEHEHKPWIAMELLEGATLGERLDEGPLPLEDVLRMAEGVLSALAEVHAEGIVHRDLKPDNIFLAKTRGPHWVPKVLDFGVAKDTSDGQLSKLTATGAVVGTAHYLSPEQAKGLADIDARADVYAMGVVLFEALSGSMPYEADTLTQLIAKMFTEQPRSLLSVAPHVPRPIADVVATCLEQERELRFQTARALLGALTSAAHAMEPRSDAGFAATAHGISPASGLGVSGVGATAHGHGPGQRSRPGGPPGSQPGPQFAGHPGSQPGSQFASQPGSQPGSQFASHGSQPGSQFAGHGSQPGSQFANHGSQPGSQFASHGSQPGSQFANHGSQPGSQFASHPGSQPGSQFAGHPGSQPGSQFAGHASHPAAPFASHPSPHGAPYASPPGHYGADPSGFPYGAAHPGFAHPGSHPSGAALTPMPSHHAGVPPTDLRAAPPERSSRLGLFALVAILFFVGAGATAAGVWFFVGDGREAPTTSVAAAEHPADPTTDDPARAPSEATPTARAPEETGPTTAAPVARVGGETEVSAPPPGEDPPPVEPSPTPEPPPAAEAAPDRPRDPPSAPDRPRDPRNRPATDDPPAPVVRPLPPRGGPGARSGLAQSQIIATVTGRFAFLQERCYERRLRHVPTLQGVVTVAWSVRPDGGVDNPQVVHNGTGDEWLARCTRNVVADMRFPRAANGLPTAARYPFMFRQRT